MDRPEIYIDDSDMRQKIGPNACEGVIAQEMIEIKVNARKENGDEDRDEDRDLILEIYAHGFIGSYSSSS